MSQVARNLMMLSFLGLIVGALWLAAWASAEPARRYYTNEPLMIRTSADSLEYADAPDSVASGGDCPDLFNRSGSSRS